MTRRPMSPRGWDGNWPPRTKPRRPAAGIKARTQRGAFGLGWWAKRWIAVLEGFALGARLARGRSYARGGQVTEIALEAGGVRAQVQGSRAKPYDVTIRMRELNVREWRAVGTAIADNVRLSAALLAGEMPEDIETAFKAAGSSLFPSSAKELKTACSCPDWSNPCKHVAAVFYLIGEEFDRDPFLLFVVRGLARDAVRDLFAATHESGAQKPGTRKRIAAAAVEPPPKNERVTAARTAAVSPASFWGDELSGSDSSRARVAAPCGDAALLKRAGKFPFWRGEDALDEAVVPIYRDATAFALGWLADHADRSDAPL